MRAIDKRRLLSLLVAELTHELARAKAAALDAAEGATHEENRAEGDKDMRSTEASYVARGYAERSAKLEQALALLSHMQVREFDATSPIEASALIELCHANKRSIYFLVVAAGGERIVLDGESVQTLATTSPLGSVLLGLREGDEAELESPQGVRSYAITSVA